MDFKETSIWQNAFEVADGTASERDKREYLKQAFLSFRSKAATLANEIPRDMSSMTVHDVTHLDALWETASLIVGSDYPINPVEAFILGGAFLTHDLAMSVSAYPDAFEKVEQTAEWADTLYKNLKKVLGRFPNKKDIEQPDPIAIEETKNEMLRSLHAIQARELSKIGWRSNSQDYEHFLIDDVSLRESFGDIIGKLAHSHWWNIEKVEIEFKDKKQGAPGGFPNSWIVDPLKLACILRCADAAHIDNRRAPSFLYSLRKPEGLSDDHWKFQSLMNQPIIEGESIRYSSNRPFGVPESSAWWIGFDWIDMINDELRQVDSILAKNERKRFAVRSVIGAENAEYLIKTIEVEGWLPVDTRIKVTDVAKLAASLGGKQLYGDDKLVPLRELIQNASDAVRARRIFQLKGENWGDVIVKLETNESESWIEVEDNGIGMSLDVLKGPFLDFGRSYWGSSLMMREWPGLASKGFEATGRFGIGFFSVFMWGDQIEIKSRRCNEGEGQTHILSFDNGLEARPLLRKANHDEVLQEVGTRIRVRLKEGHQELFSEIEASKGFANVLMRLCPSADVNLHCSETSSSLTEVVKSNDWLTVSEKEFFNRIYKYHNSSNPKTTIVKDENGKPAGRLVMGSMKYDTCKLVSGGFSCGQRYGVKGLLSVTPLTAKRDSGFSSIPEEEVYKWLEKQAAIWLASDEEFHDKSNVAFRLLMLIKKSFGLPLVLTSDGAKNEDALLQWVTEKSEVNLISSDEFIYRHFTEDNLDVDDLIFYKTNSREEEYWSYDAEWKRFIAKSRDYQIDEVVLDRNNIMVIPSKEKDVQDYLRRWPDEMLINEKNQKSEYKFSLDVILGICAKAWGKSIKRLTASEKYLCFDSRSAQLEVLLGNDLNYRDEISKDARRLFSVTTIRKKSDKSASK